jgi:hypothetical protein
MSKPIIALRTKGKRDAVDYISVHLFESLEKAETFCREQSTGKQKYWVKAEIIEEDTTIEAYSFYE